MNKGTLFIGQPMYGQLVNLLNRQKTVRLSRENGGERYTKHFDAWQHLVIMLYFVHPEKDWLKILEMKKQPPDEPTLFDLEGLTF